MNAKELKALQLEYVKRHHAKPCPHCEQTHTLYAIDYPTDQDPETTPFLYCTLCGATHLKNYLDKLPDEYPQHDATLPHYPLHNSLSESLRALTASVHPTPRLWRCPRCLTPHFVSETTRDAEGQPAPVKDQVHLVCCHIFYTLKYSKLFKF